MLWSRGARRRHAFDVAGGVAKWAAVLRDVDRSRRPLPQNELNRLLDTLALQVDAEREAAARALRPARGGRR